MLVSTKVGGRGALGPAGTSLGAANRLSEKSGGKKNSLTFLLSVRWTGKSLGEEV